jgi:hypothetical protein
MQGRPSRNALVAKAAVQTNADRESLLDRAIHAGVISTGLRSHYAAACDADPAGTRAFLGKIGLRTEAATPAVSTAPGPEEYDRSLLTDRERARIAAAREGRSHARIVCGGL